MIGKKFQKTTTLTVTNYDEETGVVTGVNDCGAEIIMTAKQVAKIYTEVKKPRKKRGPVWPNDGICAKGQC